ncbi:hypothetical protein HLA87_00240 [Mycoplasma miroungigenitalium]|uniref:HNH nuclease domain-containing protein n=1 Tax=Mycoplasma miroungigenitalium TaxID=754515 RepID=A0A6M4J8E0_9MOLU|nr:hypothetical protein [Mycoplasma miroungigenitalium]QJR43244.1 hypothetical protein HLA87_00240 [Mycoplasma miroungigenitalium]
MALINQKKAMEIWEFWLGNKTEDKDFAGRRIVKSAYNVRNSVCGWNIDHLIPITKGGKTTYGNCYPINIKTNEIKADQTTWTDNNTRWQVQKIEPTEYENSDGSTSLVKTYNYIPIDQD